MIYVTRTIESKNDIIVNLSSENRWRRFYRNLEVNEVNELKSNLGGDDEFGKTRFSDRNMVKDESQEGNRYPIGTREDRHTHLLVHLVQLGLHHHHAFPVGRAGSRPRGEGQERMWYPETPRISKLQDFGEDEEEKGPGNN